MPTRLTGRHLKRILERRYVVEKKIWWRRRELNRARCSHPPKLFINQQNTTISLGPKTANSLASRYTVRYTEPWMLRLFAVFCFANKTDLQSVAGLTIVVRIQTRLEVGCRIPIILKPRQFLRTARGFLWRRTSPSSASPLVLPQSQLKNCCLASSSTRA